MARWEMYVYCPQVHRKDDRTIAHIVILHAVAPSEDAAISKVLGRKVKCPEGHLFEVKRNLIIGVGRKEEKPPARPPGIEPLVTRERTYYIGAERAEARIAKMEWWK